ncbi:hypothetical protein LIER_39238 [Lithospermum erythrorhizon]|uniref:Uncharacterized protein n=1 Tax=Lithospermum erythrorhizon TaxID=34254 RepID=A0AAV3QBT3_LITER
MPGRRLPKREAQRMSDAKPRTSLRSYWHTLPKKKEQTPLKTRVRYNKAISVHRPSPGAVRERYRSYSSQPASSSPSSTRNGSVNESTSNRGIRFFFSAITCPFEASPSEAARERPMPFVRSHIM